MLIKAAADRTADVEALQSLLRHPQTTDEIRSRIHQEIRSIRAGARGEAEASYEIDFHHKPSRNWAVIHDLRIEHAGRVAQIDHLVINRTLDIWVCESKHFSERIAVNEAGEFTAWYGGRPYGVPSPIEQNRKHISVLASVLRSSAVELPTRLGLPLRPTIHSVVLISKNAHVTRPRRKIEGLDQIVKADQFRVTLERTIDAESAASSLVSMARLVSPETLENFARQIARLHRPIVFDWASKFGLRSTTPEAVERGAPLPGRQLTGGTKSAARTVTDDPHDGRLSTSKLAAKHGLKSAGEMLKVLTAAGYLSLDGDTHRLTSRGIAAGAVFIEKSRYGAYFLWPEALEVARGRLPGKSDDR